MRGKISNPAAVSLIFIVTSLLLAEGCFLEPGSEWPLVAVVNVGQAKISPLPP